MSSIDDELNKSTCKEKIIKLGFRDWFLSVLDEGELEISDENLSEQDFMSISEIYVDEFFDVLNS